MKRVKSLVSLLAIAMVVIMLTGCLSIKVDVKKNGSCDLTYTIDTSMLEGMPTSQLKDLIKDSVDNMNDKADKKVAKLKDIKEDKKKKTLTATIAISDINDLDTGSYFGTVKKYKGPGLDNLVNKRDKEVDEDDIPEKLQMVSLFMDEANQYGLMEVTVVVPGTIEYLTDGGNLEKKNTAVFKNEMPLVVYKKSGGFPVWLLFIAAIAAAAVVLLRKKPSNAAPAPAAPQGGNQAPIAQSNAPAAPEPAIQPDLAAPEAPGSNNITPSADPVRNEEPSETTGDSGSAE